MKNINISLDEVKNVYQVYIGYLSSKEISTKFRFIIASLVSLPHPLSKPMTSIVNVETN